MKILSTLSFLLIPSVAFAITVTPGATTEEYTITLNAKEARIITNTGGAPALKAELEDWYGKQLNLFREAKSTNLVQECKLLSPADRIRVDTILGGTTCADAATVAPVTP